MSFTGREDRRGWKKPRRGLTAADRDAIQAAIRRGDDPEEVGGRFNVSPGTARRIGGLGGRSV